MASSMRRVVVAGMIGNGMEWYDYALYGQFAAIIGALFFPQINPSLSLIATLGVFAAGFVMRPLGAIVFGYIGDRYGRKLSLTLSIFLMAIPTACIAVLPTYETIGIAAPILLTLIRLLQGLSLGGEMGSSITFITEHASARHRALAGCTSFLSMSLGILIGSLIGALCAHILEEEALKSWGWRIPFAFGLLTCMVGIYIRAQLEESVLFKETQARGLHSQSPLRDLLHAHKKELLIGMGITITITVPFYALVVFMLNYMTGVLHYAMLDALKINILGLLMMIFFIPLSAFISDRIGRKPILCVATVGFLLSLYPIFLLLSGGEWEKTLYAYLLFAMWIGIYLGPASTSLVELFPTRVRSTGLSLSYNISVALFGGTTPMIMTWLTTISGNVMISGWYVCICVIITLAALYFYRDQYREALK